jgi:20S proteasome alpha/beta subunit
MTLTNAFRARNGGVLLCADREENDSYAKTEVDKIYTITTDLKSCEVFISGAGPSEMLRKTKEHIHRTLLVADHDGKEVLAEHQALIESSLRRIYQEYETVLTQESMGLIIVVAPRTPSPPILYSTVEYRLDSQRLYCAHGSGRPISDYLADRLYNESMDTNVLKLLAVFIFREAERKAAGIGMGNDMWLIHDGGKTCREGLGWDVVEEMKRDIPQLAESLYPSWSQSPALEKWLKRT